MVSRVCSLVLATTSGGMSRSRVLATYSQSAVVTGEIGWSAAGSSASAVFEADAPATCSTDGAAAIAFDRIAAPLALISQRLVRSGSSLIASSLAFCGSYSERNAAVAGDHEGAVTRVERRIALRLGDGDAI